MKKKKKKVRVVLVDIPELFLTLMRMLLVFF